MNGHVRAIVTSVVLLACAFAVVFTATASRGASSRATYRDTNGLLAYAASVGSLSHHHSEIFTVKPDGSSVHQLTHFGYGSGVLWPDWSPDGRTIIFTRYWGEPVEPFPPRSVQILTMNADGSAMRAVTPRGLDERASYLPDGRILYYRGSSRVWVVASPDATHIRSTAIHRPPWANSLCVLANGNRLAVMRSLKVNGPPWSALFVGRLFGGPGSLKRITPYQRMDGIDCSPDGMRILFSSPYPLGRTQKKSENVFSVRPDGSGLVQLTRSHGGWVHNLALSWSPDGTKIAFIRYGHRISQWYVMNADGTAVTQIAPALAFGAAWGSHR
jgi:Tol biopolymer transport system component